MRSWYRFLQIAAFLPFVMLAAVYGHAQEPPPDDPERGRIVDGRPPLYVFKRTAHPLTWLGAGVKPVFKLAESDVVRRLAAWRPDPDRKAGIGFGVEGLGSGSGFGPEIKPFHKDLFGRGIEIEAPLLYTYKRYQSYGLNLRVPLVSGGFVERLSLDFGAAYRSRAGDKFFGIGNDSLLEDRASFRTVTREAAVGVSADIQEDWKSGLHVAFLNTGVTRPLGGDSVQDTFENGDVPGLFTGAVLLSTKWSIDHDTRDEKLPGQGSYQHFAVSLNEGIRKGDFSYWKYRFEFEQLFPLTRDRRKVIALRGTAETNQEKGGSRVPFFDMPTLGNWRTLRGYDNYRFYDKSAVSAGIEYRFRIWRPIDWAFFADAGQVGPELGDMSLGSFHTGYGIRIITLPKPDLPISFDVARSNEKWRWYVNFNKKF